MNKEKAIDKLIDVIVFIVGAAIYSSAVIMIVSPNRISPGGVTGISTLLNYLLNLPIGITVFVINIPLLVLGFINFGGIFILKTCVATAVTSLALDIAEKTLGPIILDNFLASVFGGIFMGTGLSVVMLRGGTTGGMDIVAKLINKRFPHITVGRIMLFGDAAVVLLAAVVYKNPESALYSVVALYASSKIMDYLLYGADKGKIVYLITRNPDEISREIMKTIMRGVTVTECTGGYTGEKHKMLMCTVRRAELSAVLGIIRKKDRRAFIVVAEAGEIIGEGFKKIDL